MQSGTLPQLALQFTVLMIERSVPSVTFEQKHIKSLFSGLSAVLS